MTVQLRSEITSSVPPTVKGDCFRAAQRDLEAGVRSYFPSSPSLLFHLGSLFKWLVMRVEPLPAY